MSTCTKCLQKEAALRCKMCHKPICKDCGITAPAGIFCSDECAQKMSAHMEKVKEFDEERPVIKQRKVPTLLKLIILLAVLWLIARLLGIDIVARTKELINSFHLEKIKKIELPDLDIRPKIKELINFLRGWIAKKTH